MWGYHGTVKHQPNSPIAEIIHHSICGRLPGKFCCSKNKYSSFSYQHTFLLNWIGEIDRMKLLLRSKQKILTDRCWYWAIKPSFHLTSQSFLIITKSMTDVTDHQNIKHRLALLRCPIFRNTCSWKWRECCSGRMLCAFVTLLSSSGGLGPSCGFVFVFVGSTQEVDHLVCYLVYQTCDRPKPRKPSLIRKRVNNHKMFIVQDLELCYKYTSDDYYE